ncbi:MAG: hypothetical protein Q7O66_07280 [Dehalococcoidia bacterium]|nr:hypothetical protein [Dehalococcoidia bacterium]
MSESQFVAHHCPVCGGCTFFASESWLICALCGGHEKMEIFE